MAHKNNLLPLRKAIRAEELPEYMKRWEDKLPDYVKIEEIGKCGEFPILAAFFTDSSVDDSKKQIALFTAQHSGMEITGMTTLLSLGNYLASGAEDAMEILKKQIVVIVPCSNPYSYSKLSPEYQFKNEAGVDEYVSFKCDGVPEPEKAPAAYAMQKLIDRLKPELLIDCHGVLYEHQMVLESLGYSAFVLNRMHDRRFCDLIQKGANERGFGVMNEDLMQKLIPSEEMCKKPSFRARFRPGAEGGPSTVYSYINYHTLAATMEIHWEESGMYRLLSALKFGNEEYPVNIIAYPQGHHAVCVGGKDAAETRENRIRLWQNADKISTGLIHPELIGIGGLLVTTSKEKIQRYFREHQEGLPIESLLEDLKDEPNMDMNGLKKFFEENPKQHAALHDMQESEESVSMGGMVIRLVAPFEDAKATKVILNGRELSKDEYTTKLEECNYYVEIMIPEDYEYDTALALFTYDCKHPQEGIMDF